MRQGGKTTDSTDDEIEEHDVVVVVAKADGNWLGVVSLALLKRKLEQLHFFLSSQ